MNLKTLVLVLNTERAIKEPAVKFRGHIADRFKEYPILHHHIEEAGYLYTYPQVQYKIIEGTALILGIEEDFMKPGDLEIHAPKKIESFK